MIQMSSGISLRRPERDLISENTAKVLTFITAGPHSVLAPFGLKFEVIHVNFSCDLQCQWLGQVDTINFIPMQRKN